jgi:hypothetical protein
MHLIRRYGASELRLQFRAGWGDATALQNVCLRGKAVYLSNTVRLLPALESPFEADLLLPRQRTSRKQLWPRKLRAPAGDNSNGSGKVRPVHCAVTSPIAPALLTPFGWRALSGAPPCAQTGRSGGLLGS